METNDTEREILQKALEGLQKTANINVQVQPGKDDFDAILRIRLHEMEWDFAAEVKNRITPATLGVIVQRLRKLPGKGLIVTRYVTPQLADRMREIEIQFIDTAGNAYINEPPLFIFIKGNRALDKDRKDRPTRAFQPTGLQVVFALLCNCNLALENEPFRTIAQRANAALGTVGWVIRDLKQMGYLVDMGKRGRRLVRRKDLLDRWVAAYPEQLRPKKLLGNYQADDIDWWENKEIENFGAFWGGEVAAAYLTKYLKPKVVTIYAKEPGRIVLTHRLRKKPDGNVEILKIFWNFEHLRHTTLMDYTDLVHPILIYADLMATGDARNIETAEIIYEQQLAYFIEKN
jgi:hypothetical protein